MNPLHTWQQKVADTVAIAFLTGGDGGKFRENWEQAIAQHTADLIGAMAENRHSVEMSLPEALRKLAQDMRGSSND